jgi:hypothetical protein
LLTRQTKLNKSSPFSSKVNTRQGNLISSSIAREISGTFRHIVHNARHKPKSQQRRRHQHHHFGDSHYQEYEYSSIRPSKIPYIAGVESFAVPVYFQVLAHGYLSSWTLFLRLTTSPALLSSFLPHHRSVEPLFQRSPTSKETKTVR